MTKEYWDRLFSARERGAHVVWYNGAALNPIFQAAGLEWCHGEAFSARLAAMHLEGPAQLAGEEYGYISELCSYSRTHLGCAVLTNAEPGTVRDGRRRAGRPGDAGEPAADAGLLRQRLRRLQHRPAVGRDLLPHLRKADPALQGLLPDALGQQARTPATSAARSGRRPPTGSSSSSTASIEFIEAQTGRKFDWDALRESMWYIKRAADAAPRGDATCASARPAPATYWDWIASIAPINFLPGNQALVDYFAARQGRDRAARWSDERPGAAERALPARTSTA